MKSLFENRSRALPPIMAMLTALFLLAELGFWIAVQLDFKGYNHLVDYAAVIVAVAFGLLTALANPGGEWLLRIGLIFTLFADYHLVYSYPMDRMLGMVFFNITQISYFLYLLFEDASKKKRIIHLGVRALAVGVAVLLCYLVLGEGADTLSVISMIYFANLAISALWCLVSRRFLLFAGLVAFALCDVTVGMQALIDLYMDVPVGSFMWQIVHSDFNFIWFFYVPSQTIIALTALGKCGWESIFSVFKNKHLRSKM